MRFDIAFVDIARGIRVDDEGISRCDRFSMELANVELGTPRGFGATDVDAKNII